MIISKITSIRSMQSSSQTISSKFHQLKSSTKSIKVALQLSETCQQLLAVSPGLATCSIASLSLWNSFYQSSLNREITRNQLSSTTRLVILYSLMNTYGAKNGHLRLRKQKLVYKQLLLFVILTIINFMLTLTLRF